MEEIEKPAGVSFDNGKQKWVVRFMFNGERMYLGCFPTVEGAIKARKDFQRNMGAMEKPKLSKPTQRLIKAFEWLRKHGNHLPADKAALEYIKQMTL